MKRIKRYVHLHPEIVSAPVGFAIIVASYFVLNAAFGDTAGLIDPGKIQRIPFVIWTLAIFSGASFIGIKFNWFGLYDFYKKVFIDHVEELTPWQKAKLLVALYLGLLACCCWLAQTYAQ